MNKTDQMSAEEFAAYNESKGKVGKYLSKRVTIDGMKFDSIKEGEYYGVEKMKLRAGEIKSFRRQVRYKIVINGIKICTYVADFVEYFHDGTIRVIDVKSDFTRTLSLYVLKKKLMLALYGIKIIEV
jgi:hypothetical protein